MDPVSGIWAALSIIQVIETAVRLARSIQRAETKGVDLMVYRLVLEKKRFTHWANRMRTLEADTVRKIITREDEMIVMKVKASLEEHIRSAEERLARFKIAKEKTVGGLLVRARIAYRGYEDVKELLDAMKTMNEVLYSIAPPAPPSYHQADFLRPGEAFADRHGSSLQELPSERDLRRPSPSSLLRERRNDGIAETDQSVPNDQPEVDGDAALRDLEVEELRLPLRTLFKSTLKPLDLIVSLQSDPRISKIRQRLNVWGSGLFEGSYDLDSILDAGREPQKALLDVLREALIKILVLEGESLFKICRFITVNSNPAEQELANYNMTSGAIDEMKRKDLQQASSDLTILLGGEDIGLSLYYKSAIVDSLEHHHSNLWDILSAGQTVEDLFELLPAISTIQQGVCLQSERLQEKKGIEQEPSPGTQYQKITRLI